MKRIGHFTIGRFAFCYRNRAPLSFVIEVPEISTLPSNQQLLSCHTFLLPNTSPKVIILALLSATHFILATHTDNNKWWHLRGYFINSPFPVAQIY